MMKNYEESRKGEDGKRPQKASATSSNEEYMTTDTVGLQFELSGEHPPYSFHSSHFVSSSICQEGIEDEKLEEEEEVRVSIVTIKADFCPLEPFSTAHLERTGLIKETRTGGNKEEDAAEKKSMNRSDVGEDEEQLTCIFLQSQVGPQSTKMCSVLLIEQICISYIYFHVCVCVCV